MTTTQERPTGPQRFDARNLQQNSVTVFTDGAEVQRVFDNLPWQIDSGSVHFDVDHAARIEAVQFTEEHATWAKMDSPQVTEVVKQQQDLQRKLASKKAQKVFYEKSLNKKMERLLLDSEPEPADKHSELNAYYQKHFSDIQALILSVEAEIEELEAQDSKYEEQVQEMRSSEAKKKSIFVTISSPAKAQIKLTLTYLVHNACWSPYYVVHVTTGRDKAIQPDTTNAVAPAKAHMKLHYMAEIRQNTGETWNAKELVLSTAQVREVRPLPKLVTLRTKLQPGNKGYEQPPRVAMLAEKQMLSTTYKVSAPNPIASASSEHNLTIALLSFETQVCLECVPSKSTEVLQTASALNDSDYPLLAGCASVYVDNNFSSKTRLTAVPVDDRFVCTLGIDSDIKVEYAPAYYVRSFVKKMEISDHVQKILVKNLKAYAVPLTVHEQVPKSTDDQIKVNLLSPNVKQDADTSQGQKTLDHPRVGPRLNADHNLEWTVLLQADEQRELLVKWSLEYPVKTAVKYVEDV